MGRARGEQLHYVLLTVPSISGRRRAGYACYSDRRLEAWWTVGRSCPAARKDLIIDSALACKGQSSYSSVALAQVVQE